MEETATRGEARLQVPVCGFLSGANGRMHKEMVSLLVMNGTTGLSLSSMKGVSVLWWQASVLMIRTRLWFVRNTGMLNAGRSLALL